MREPKILPEQENNVERLKTIVENAKRSGNQGYADRAQKRIWELRAVGKTELDKRFNAVLAAYESMLTEKNERTTRATYTIRKIRNKGVKQTVIDWALSEKPTEGFSFLIQQGHWKMTAEYLVVSMPDEFPTEVVASARKKLVDAGIDLNQNT